MPYIIDRGKVVPVNVNNKYNSKPLPYQMNDIPSVFTHWDNNLKKNVTTPNELPVVGDDENNKNKLNRR